MLKYLHEYFFKIKYSLLKSYVKTVYCETPIMQTKCSVIGKLNNPAQAEGIIFRSLLRNLFPRLALGFIPVITSKCVTRIINNYWQMMVGLNDFPQ